MIYLVAGARPNFVKLAAVVRALHDHGGLKYSIVHTGQHYDDALSGSFFRVLEIPAPDIHLEVGQGTPVQQTAGIIQTLGEVLKRDRPRAIVVFGDVTSTLAAALTAAQMQIPVVHVEAGLRSFDRSMPEELNRIVTDAVSSLLLVSEPSGVANLRAEGVPPERIRLVGNVMIDTLRRLLPQAVERCTCRHLGVVPGAYAFLTMHRPSNVDSPRVLNRLMETFGALSRQLPILFAVHPRTRARLPEAGWDSTGNDHFRLIDPVDYLDSLCLQQNAAVVFTDSGGMQEETTALGVRCITLRDNTERPITVEQGTSVLVGNSSERIVSTFEAMQEEPRRQHPEIEWWDGHSARRVVEHLINFLNTAAPEGAG